MSQKLNDRLLWLERQLKVLQAQLNNLTNHTATKRISPETKISQENRSKVGQPLPSTGTGLGRIHGRAGNVIWNDAEGKTPGFKTQPIVPTKGYNKHNHSRFSGGALDIHSLELVEYETVDPEAEDPIILGADGNPVNKHCQSYWNSQPKIIKDNEVEKIGYLDIQFDSSSKKWVTGSNIIDVERTYLAQYVWKLGGDEVPPGTEGATREIKTDANGNQMKAPLLSILEDSATIAGRNENLNKSNVYWDKDAQCWRFYAVFKPYPEEEE